MTLDILDRTTTLPAESEEEKSLNGLVALTMIAWQQRTAVGSDELSRGVEEFELSDTRGEARAGLGAVLAEPAGPRGRGDARNTWRCWP